MSSVLSTKKGELHIQNRLGGCILSRTNPTEQGVLVQGTPFGLNTAPQVFTYLFTQWLVTFLLNHQSVLLQIFELVDLHVAKSREFNSTCLQTSQSSITVISPHVRLHSSLNWASGLTILGGLHPIRFTRCKGLDTSVLSHLLIVRTKGYSTVLLDPTQVESKKSSQIQWPVPSINAEPVDIFLGEE